ncbi:FadR/GntR family transcriptional regulator [Aureimonas sp. AU40]|uniref:FadR/GntR family transcriptional regulator n=1 Tax=Aureimonas sp. AU40 TaxID=1637747 RepID=UPI000784014F|nr:FCD domain-containing protein [Aureimonas sp. AU40]
MKEVANPKAQAEAGSGSVVNRLVDEIRELLAVRGLRAGDPFPTERELCEILGASRNTVREALVILRAFGLIETRPKSGAIVSDGHAAAVERLFSFHQGVSAEGFRDVQGFRRILETGVGDHIILHASEADLDHLQAVNDRILGAGGVAELARADYEFHEALIALSGNGTARATFRMLRPAIENLMRVGKEARIVEVDTHAAHLEIVAALRERDRVAYAYLIGRHLSYGLRFIAASEQTQTQTN